MSRAEALHPIGRSTRLATVAPSARQRRGSLLGCDNPSMVGLPPVGSSRSAAQSLLNAEHGPRAARHLASRHCPARFHHPRGHQSWLLRSRLPSRGQRLGVDGRDQGVPACRTGRGRRSDRAAPGRHSSQGFRGRPARARDEAQVQVGFDSHPSIVSSRNFFRAHDTA